MSVAIQTAKEMVKSFLDGPDRSTELALELSVFLDEHFPDDDIIQDLVIAASSYRPGGGELLHDEDELLRECERTLMRLNRLAG